MHTYTSVGTSKWFWIIEVQLYLFSWAVGTRNRIRMSHGKRAIGVRVIEVRLKVITVLL